MSTPVENRTATPAASPRSALRLIADAFGLYRRYPLLFLMLASAVIVPYQLIVLAAAGSFDRSELPVGLESFLSLLDWGLVSPLVSALHIHAVAETREGRTPRLGPVARRGVVALPVVAAASIISTLGIAVGLIALIIPGIYLLLRWAVVAQAAAVEREGWMSALNSSHRLTEGHYGHVILFVLLVSLITWTPILVLDLGLEGSTDAASFVVGLVVQIFALSFTALAAALLYYDLRARLELSAAPERAPDPGAGGDSLARADRPWDPRAFSDQDRPKGWYVDPASPTRMRYWRAGDEPGWAGTTSTPRKVRQAWMKEARPEP